MTSRLSYMTSSVYVGTNKSNRMLFKPAWRILVRLNQLFGHECMRGDKQLGCRWWTNTRINRQQSSASLQDLDMGVEWKRFSLNFKGLTTAPLRARIGNGHMNGTILMDNGKEQTYF